jgi:prepilin-type N-terminal cleavage/methylation domain-containing protein
MRRLFGRCPGDESGFTLVELTVVLLISGIVGVSALGMLVSATNAEKRTSRAANNQEVLRQAIIEVAKDVRSSDPIVYQANVADFATQLPMRIRNVADENERYVRWRLDTTSSTFVREELDSNGNVTATSYRVPGMVAQTIFTYYRADGSAYTLSGLDAGAVDRCTVRVHVALKAAPQSGPAPSLVETDVQVRNRLPLPNEVFCTSLNA